MPNTDRPKRKNRPRPAENKTEQSTLDASSDAPLVDSALSDIRDRRARQAAAAGTGRPRQRKKDI